MTFTLNFGFWMLPAIFTASVWISCYRVNARMNQDHLGIFAFVSSTITVIATLVAWSIYFAARLYLGLPQ